MLCPCLLTAGKYIARGLQTDEHLNVDWINGSSGMNWRSAQNDRPQVF
jgi:hypothetical protein